MERAHCTDAGMSGARTHAAAVVIGTHGDFQVRARCRRRSAGDEVQTLIRLKDGASESSMCVCVRFCGSKASGDGARHIDNAQMDPTNVPYRASSADGFPSNYSFPAHSSSLR